MRKTLWSNKNWTIEEYEDKKVMIHNHNSTSLNWVIAYPILYKHTREVAYDNPYVIPKYVKDKVKTILLKLNK